ncbi:MAG: hypothetical protein HON65_01085 [Rhodospirillales bacterium]|jgi:hypothetical protein|nr:hypothetical protein [Rhodospirillales bacterium]
MAKAATKNKPKKGKKKKFSIGFYLVLGGVFGIPLVGLLVWYFTTMSLQVSGSSLSASEFAQASIAKSVEKAKSALKDKLEERARLEGFRIEEVDNCTDIESQYQLPVAGTSTNLTLKQLLGLPAAASFAQVSARCVVFAKAVQRMERLSHHDRHVFVCQNASFSNDESGRFAIFADKKGRGIIESFSGTKKLIEIPRGSHSLVRQWQIFNLGDGCVIIGLSKDGIFSMSGSVNLQ